jgi:hypothetical protein
VGTVRRREPARLGEPLAGLLTRLDPQGRMRVFRLWDFWAEIVGPGIAERAVPLRVVDEVLVVQVSNHTWMQELVFLKEDIRTRLNERLGAPLLKDLRFVLGSTRRASPARPRSEDKTLLAPVAVPDLPSTGSAELDEVLLRVATSLARWRQAEKPKKKKKGSGAGGRGSGKSEKN